MLSYSLTFFSAIVIRKRQKIAKHADRYHLPEHIAAHVDYITPGIKMTQAVKRTVKKEKRGSNAYSSRTSIHAPAHWGNPGNSGTPSSDLASCSYNMTPPCIRALYGIPLPTDKPNPDNALGLYEQGDYFAKSDLDLYWKNIYNEVPEGTYPVPQLIDGANYSVPAYSSLNGGESNIDMEMSYVSLVPRYCPEKVYHSDSYLFGI
jgi:tripeptidyl-peptidase I